MQAGTTSAQRSSAQDDQAKSSLPRSLVVVLSQWRLDVRVAVAIAFPPWQCPFLSFPI